MAVFLANDQFILERRIRCRAHVLCDPCRFFVSILHASPPNVGGKSVEKVRCIRDLLFVVHGV